MNFDLQFLKGGKALCGKAFPNFVATWNWLVNFCANAKGDADVNDAQGHIKVDRADPAHPIIRCTGCSTSSGGSSTAGQIPSAFGYTATYDESTGALASLTISNCWYMRGSIAVDGSRSFTIDVSTGDCTIWAIFDCSSTTATLYDVQAFFSDENPTSSDISYCVPLYKVSGGTVIDLRTAPQLQVWDSL